MSELSIGTIVHLKGGQTVKVKKQLGDGGQGYVYLVDCGGKDMALKWYKNMPSSKPEEFYKNLCKNATNGAPSSHFIWPKYVTIPECGSFGYVMDLFQTGYYEFSKFLVGKQHFSSFFAMITAAMEICEAFKALHARGLSYQDLNDGNFVINPKNGHVFICDNDNAFPNYENSGILGKARYIAPEVVTGKKLPNAYSDKFSLSLILFMLFYMNHPFEGAKVVSAPCMTESLEKKFYGTDILFICDQTDKSNQPVRGIHNNVIKLWSVYPAILRQTFISEFSKEKLQIPEKRFTEQQWLEVLTIVRDSLITCPYCKKETFVSVNSTNKCVECGKPINITNTMTIGKRELVLTNYNNLYLDRDDIPDMRVMPNPNDPSKSIIQNLTEYAWKVDTPSGKIVTVESKGFMPVKSGLVVTMKVRENNYKGTIK